MDDILKSVDEDASGPLLRPRDAGAGPRGGRGARGALQGARRSGARLDPQQACRSRRGVRLRLRRRPRPRPADGVAPPQGAARRRTRGIVAPGDVGVLPTRSRRGRRAAGSIGRVSRVVFTGPHAALAAALGAGAHARRAPEGAVAGAIEELDLPPPLPPERPPAGADVLGTPPS